MTYSEKKTVMFLFYLGQMIIDFELRKLYSLDKEERMENKGSSTHWSELSSDSGTHYCVSCGRSDDTVRFVSYPYVFSLIFVSYRLKE